jgi:hypothetical protein
MQRLPDSAAEKVVRSGSHLVRDVVTVWRTRDEDHGHFRDRDRLSEPASQPKRGFVEREPS